MKTISTPVSGAMPAAQLLALFQNRGCEDITSTLDLSNVPAIPTSRGGQGDIYKGKLTDGREVAIKIIRMIISSNSNGEDKKIQQVAHELYIWTKCKHRNILELFGMAIFHGHLAMISPWIDNGSLDWFISQNPEVDRYDLCAQVAEAIAYMHLHGIVHGDIKCGNILVSSDHVIKVMDFGSSTLKRDYSLKLKVSSGQPAYSLRWAAPELLTIDEEPKFEADIYALGMTFYEIMSGEVPYHEVKLDVRLMCLIMSHSLPKRPGCMAEGDAQADLLWLLMEDTWAKDPQDRPMANEVCERALLAVASALPAITQPAPAKKKALLIGLSYKQSSDSSRHLRYATQDARRLADALPKLGYSSETIDVVTDEPGQPFPSAEYLLERIDQFVQGASAGDELVFGYSGHCDHPRANSSDSKYRLVAADLKPISRPTLHERLIAKVPAGAKLTLVLECCNAAGIVPLNHCVEQMKPEHWAPTSAPAQAVRRQGRVAGAPPMFGVPAGIKGPFSPGNMARRPIQAPIAVGLSIGKLSEPTKDLTPPAGDIVVWAATEARLKAFEAFGGVKNGVFTNAICNVLDTCDANKTITKRDIWQSISMDVTRENELRRERDMKKDPKASEYNTHN